MASRLQQLLKMPNTSEVGIFTEKSGSRLNQIIQQPPLEEPQISEIQERREISPILKKILPSGIIAGLEKKPLIEKAPATLQTLAELQIDPLSLKEKPSKTLKSAWEGLKRPFEELGSDIKDVFTEPFEVSKKVGKGAEIVADIGGVIFSPITALFEGANKVPILGSISRLLSLPFVALGEGGTNVADEVIDRLPISEKAKEDIQDGVREIFALGAQLVGGKALQLGGKKIGELRTKFGESGLKTITEQAQKLAEQVQEPAPIMPDGTPLSAAEIRQLSESKMTTGEFQQFMEARAKGEAPPIEPIISESLAQEARKYKSAEEFVNNSKNVVYRGSAGSQQNVGGQFFSDSKDYASGFTGAGKGTVGQYAIPKDSLLDTRKPADLAFLKKNLSSQEFQYVMESGNGKLPSYAVSDIIDDLAKESGYKGIVFHETVYKGKDLPTYYVFDSKDVSTKSQLTDIWNKANKTKSKREIIEVPREQLPVRPLGEAEKGVSTLEARMKGIVNDQNIKVAKAEAEAKGLDVSIYDKINKAEQLKLAANYVEKNSQKKILDILKGDEPTPKGLLTNALMLALEEKSLRERNVDTAIKLASLRSTRMGQEISILTEVSGISPVSGMEAIIRARVARAKTTLKTGETLETKKTRIKTDLEKTEKINRLKFEEATRVLNEIVCK